MAHRTPSVVALAAAVLAAAPAARADTLLTPAPGARNLTAAGGTAAWAAPAGGGRWKLVLRGRDGVVRDAPVPTFGAAPDPGLGSDAFTGQHLVAVYSRCSGSSSVHGCDVYRYDLVTRRETKVALAASRTYSEIAPSIANGRIGFVRRGNGPRRGVFAVIPSFRGGAGHLNRIDGHLARETATSQSRVVFLYRNTKGQDDLTLGQLDGHNRRLMTRAQPGMLFSPVITRYRLGWLEHADAAVVAKMTDRINPSDTAPNVRSGRHTLPASTDSAVTDSSSIDAYLDARGYTSVAPPLFPSYG